MIDAFTSNFQPAIEEREVRIARLHHRVDAAATVDRVHTETTGQEVFSRAAGQYVVSCATVERDAATDQRVTRQGGAGPRLENAQISRGRRTVECLQREAASAAASIGNGDRRARRIQTGCQPRIGSTDGIEHILQGSCGRQPHIDVVLAE